MAAADAGGGGGIGSGSSDAGPIRGEMVITTGAGRNESLRINVCDSPEDVARAFCLERGLSDRVYRLLVDELRAALVVVQRQEIERLRGRLAAAEGAATAASARAAEADALSRDMAKRKKHIKTLLQHVASLSFEMEDVRSQWMAVSLDGGVAPQAGLLHRTPSLSSSAHPPGADAERSLFGDAGRALAGVFSKRRKSEIGGGPITTLDVPAAAALAATAASTDVFLRGGGGGGGGGGGAVLGRWQTNPDSATATMIRSDGGPTATAV